MKTNLGKYDVCMEEGAPSLSCKGNAVGILITAYKEGLPEDVMKGCSSSAIPSYPPSPWLSNKYGLGCIRAPIGANIFFFFTINNVLCKERSCKILTQESVNSGKGLGRRHSEEKNLSDYSSRPILNQS